MVGAGHSPETLVDIYRSTRCHITQSIYLKSHVMLIYEYHTFKFSVVWKLACLSGFVIKRKGLLPKEQIRSRYVCKHTKVSIALDTAVCQSFPRCVITVHLLPLLFTESTKTISAVLQLNTKEL